MSGLGPSIFRPSEAKLRFFISEAGDIWTEDSVAAARSGPESGFSQLGLTPSLSRVSVAANIAGFGSEPESLAGAIRGGPNPVQHPMRASIWEIDLLLSLLGKSAAPVQLDASTAFRHVISNRETPGVDWVSSSTERALWLYFDKTGEFNERMGPAWAQSWVLNIANNSVVNSLWNFIYLQFSKHEGVGAILPSNSQVLPIVRGLYTEANNALVGAEQVLNLQVVSIGAEAGTVADPKTIVFKADLGSSPVYGSITFTVTTGVEPGEGGNPRWARVIDSTSGSNIGAQDIGAQIEVAVLDVAATGYVALDEVTLPLVASFTPSLTTEPPLLSVHSCVSLRATQDNALIETVTPESLDMTITSDRQMVAGGFCRAMSQSDFKSGNETTEWGFARKWISDKVQSDMLLGAKLGHELTIDSGIEIDPGTSNEHFKIIIRTPNLRPSDGSTLKTFAAGATDESETLAYRAYPDASINDASVEVEVIAAVADAEV